MRGRRWTEKEDLRIMKTVKSSRIVLSDIADEISRSKDAVWKRAQRIGARTYKKRSPGLERA